MCLGFSENGPIEAEDDEGDDEADAVDATASDDSLLAYFIQTLDVMLECALFVRFVSGILVLIFFGCYLKYLWRQKYGIDTFFTCLLNIYPCATSLHLKG